MKPPLDTWIPLAELAQRLNTTPRTIQSLVAAGGLRKTTRPCPGRRPVTVLHPDDVARYQATLMPEAPHALVRVPRPMPPPALPAPATPLLKPLAMSLADLEHRRILTLLEACRLFGFSRANLRRLLLAGQLQRVPGEHALKFFRADLDDLCQRKFANHRFASQTAGGSP